MKKSAWIILTIVASLTISSCANQTIPQNMATPYFSDEDSEIADTTRYYQPLQYDYYYHSRLWDGLFRLFRPHRYHQLIAAQGYVPLHRRVARSSSDPKPVSAHPHHNRGGFGHTGSFHSVVG